MALAHPESFPPAPTGLTGRRVLPHNQEAEESVIGGILFNGRTFSQVVEFVEATDFYHNPLRAIYEAMMDLDQMSQPIDMITVAERMRQNNTIGKLRAYNGEAYLAELATQIATVENITYHAQIVREKAMARRLIEGATKVVEKGYTDYPDVNEYIDEAQQIIFEIANKSSRQGYEPIRKVLHTAIKALEHRYSRKEAITGIASGYHRFDEMTTGLQPGELVIVAARPSMGKTAFALNCVQHAAMQHRVPSLVFSLEMSKESLIERVLCSEAHIDSQKLRRGMLTTKEWVDLTKAAGMVSEAPIWIDDSGAPTLMEIRAKARRWRSDPHIFNQGLNQMGLVVVDYLQLVQGSVQGRDGNREREISEISRGLKALAKELSVPVIALSQLNRSVESRADKRPISSDLRECVTGDTLVLQADGQAVPIWKLVGTLPSVLAMSSAEKMMAAKSEKIWPVGKRPILSLRFASGRLLRATSLHRLYGAKGWVQVGTLAVGDLIAIARPFGESARFQSGQLIKEAESDLFWDRVVEISPAGVEEVFDLTVPGPASWLADGIVSHNSGAIEQDADLICFIYRDEVYNKESKDKGVAELIIGKQRNGPTGMIRLAFLNQYTRFENLAEGRGE